MSDIALTAGLALVAVASQPVRFGILGLARHGWFLAREAADELGVERGTIREHADTLVTHGLAIRRSHGSARKPTFQWRVTAAGADLRDRIEELVEQRSRSAETETSQQAVVVALASGDSQAELLQTLISSVREAIVEPAPGYVIRISAPTNPAGGV